MKICDVSKIKDKKQMVLLPKYDYNILDSVEYCFENIVNLETTIKEDEKNILVKFINQNVKQIFIFNFDGVYREILPYIKKTVKIKNIYTHNLAKMTDLNIKSVFDNILEFYDRKIITEIGCLDFSTYKVLSKKDYNVKHLFLDLPQKAPEKIKSNTIGLLGNDYDPNHNTYNLLSAVRMVDYDKIKMIRQMPATEHFIKFFNIREQKVDTLEEAMQNNFVNLYANFTSTRFDLILKSMDSGIPCLLGNTDIFDEHTILKKDLVLDSDDDIREIAQKISNIKDNTEMILAEYKKFRINYSELSKNSIIKFIQE